ncbi:nucleolar DEAD-box protein required for synthesis of 60S ribosomal subunit [Thelotrema lepadinum]|nr:nucleolar DEAD-box protein required for synthesis of 60S ribosomal subunit [Thelotrema lepadinum]
MAAAHGMDDFVLTISDDEALPFVEEEDEEVQHEPQQLLKRKLEEIENEAPEEPQKSKKQKKKRKKNAGSNGVTAEHQNGHSRSSQSQEQVDQAMDPDFEFQVGDIDGDIMSDFDGWGVRERVKENGVKGDKKGVDIDELVARRRKRKDEPEDDEDEESNQWDGLSESEDEAPLRNRSEKSAKTGKKKADSEESDDNADEDDEQETDDELLAPDAFGMGVTGEDGESDVADAMIDMDELDETSASENDSVASTVPHPLDEASDADEPDEDEDEEEKARQQVFFAPETEDKKSKAKNQAKSGSFQLMALSRPILRGLAAIGFSDPTPIQAKTIPIALLGKDIVGGAVTGSGKTAAFLVPILERLLYRPKKIPTSRVAILMPTRELAVQCFAVARKLATFTDINFCQLVGGFSLREQENILKKRPDVIIATPGRFIDHMRNSASFTLDTLEILVLDEADRMLEDGFADELNEILTTIPKSRQTMLFSATMTSSVDKLIRVGLQRPVRLIVDSKRQTVGTLTQEFVRLRPGREKQRIAYLLHLCTEVFTDRVIIFFRQKRDAHRIRIVFALFGFKAAELHGSMSQEQRITSVESFRAGTVTHLLATDVASRGLDIKGVETVLNYEAPQSLEIYLHRVGRTARAGRTGRACTIAAEPDRKVVKAAVKTARSQGAKIVSRVVEAKDVDSWSKKLRDIEGEVEEVMKEEKEEKALAQVDMQVRKGENMMVHEAEIRARPRRTWFESEKEKESAKEKGKNELNGVEAGSGEKRKKAKLSGKDKKRLEDKRERSEGREWKKGSGDRGAVAPKGREKKTKTKIKEKGGKASGKLKVGKSKARGSKGKRR